MKVLRLIEADSNTILSVKNKFMNDPDSNSKMQTLKGFLINQCGLKGESWRILEDLGIDFLAQWMDAFKWEEAGRPGNEFIAFLNGPAEHVISNKDRFIKAYNCYAADLINSDDELENHPLYNPSIYRYPADDIKKIVGYWSRSIDNFYKTMGGLSDDERDERYSNILNSFYERSGNDYNVRTLAEIEQIMRAAGQDTQRGGSSDHNKIIDLLKNKDNFNFAKEYIANNSK